MLYWACVSVLFIFLAIDEYFSIHEAIIFWRGGYLILGGMVALFSLGLIMSNQVSNRRLLMMFVVGLGIMGVSGVVLDAFSTQSLLDIGPLEFNFVRCNGTFLGVFCRDFSNTEETFELFGAAVMWLSLSALTYDIWLKHQLKRPRQLIYGVGLAWVIGLMALLWLAPALQARNATPAQTVYDDLTLVAYDISADTLRSSETLQVTLYLEANRNLRTIYSMSVHLYTRPDAASLTQDDMELGNFVYPTSAWVPTLPVQNTFSLTIPDDVMPQTSYQLVAILWQDTPTNRIAVASTILTTFGDGTTLVLDSVAIPAENVPDAPTTTAYYFANGITLEGYTLAETGTTGDSLQIDFWWTTSQAIETSLVQFLHWFEVGGDGFYTFDRVPFDRRFPTEDWVPNLRLYDVWQLTLPDEMPAGRYRLQTGWYRASDIVRVPATTESGDVVADASAILGEIVVE